MGDLPANPQFNVALRARGRASVSARNLYRDEKCADVLRDHSVIGGHRVAPNAHAEVWERSWLEGLVKRETPLFPYRAENISSLVLPMGGLDREVMLVLYLDEAGRMIAAEVHRDGNSTSFSMGYRVLFKHAFDHHARGLILAHNHPSGSATPSARDVHSTSALEALAAPMEIRLVDHLIVGGRTVFSMRNAGLLR